MNIKILTYIKQYDDNNITVEFKDLILLDGEEFRDLVTPLYPDILPVYKISNMNRVYSTILKRLLSVKIKKSGNGYYSVKLQTLNPESGKNKGKDYGMHRLMMAIFHPVDNMEKLFINHKDGNKANNDLNNLEWCTCSENTQHAVDMGLCVALHGDDAPWSKITSETAHKICQLLEKHEMTHAEIAKECGVSKTIVTNISSNGCWKEVSSQYNLIKSNIARPPKKFSLQDLHKYCKYFEDNPYDKSNLKFKNYLRRMTSHFNDPFDNKVYYILRGVYRREYFTKVSSQYSF